MKDYITLGGMDIPLRIVKSRGARIGLHFSSRGAVLEVRTPTGRLGRQERQALQAHRAWILKNYAQRQALQEARDVLRERLLGGEALYLGEYLPINRYAEPGRGRVSVDAEGLHLIHPAGQEPPHPMIQLYDGLRTLARHQLPPVVRDIAQQTALSINEIRVKDVKTRWGSCSSKRNINLNWHLILLREDLIRYLIIHELMHLHEMNHSEKYWAWVEKYCPDYKILDQELSAKEWLIGIFDPWVKPDRSD